MKQDLNVPELELAVHTEINGAVHSRVIYRRGKSSFRKYWKMKLLLNQLLLMVLFPEAIWEKSILLTLIHPHHSVNSIREFFAWFRGSVKPYLGLDDCIIIFVKHSASIFAWLVLSLLKLFMQMCVCVFKIQGIKGATLIFYKCSDATEHGPGVCIW